MYILYLYFTMIKCLSLQVISTPFCVTLNNFLHISKYEFPSL